MALVKKQDTRTRSLLIILGIALVLGGGFFFYITRSKTDTKTQSDPVIQNLEQSVRDLKVTDESLQPDLENLLKDRRFLELHQYGALPVDIGKTGRPNPFLPL